MESQGSAMAQVLASGRFPTFAHVMARPASTSISTHCSSSVCASCSTASPCASRTRERDRRYPARRRLAGSRPRDLDHARCTWSVAAVEDPLHLMLEIIFFGGAAIALLMTRRRWPALAFAALYVFNRTLMYVWAE
jgi:hypothetical protein